MAHYAILSIIGVARPEDYATIKATLEDSLAVECEIGRFFFKDTDRIFAQGEVLRSYNLSWARSTRSDGDKARTISYHDALSGTHGVFVFVDGEIVVPSSKIDDPAFVQQGHDALAWANAGNLRLVHSAHERVELLRQLHQLRTASTIPYPDGERDGDRHEDDRTAP